MLAHLESSEFKWVFRLKNPTIIEPSLWPKVLRIITPQEFHPAHRIWLIVHHIPFVHIEPIRQCVVRETQLRILQETCK